MSSQALRGFQKALRGVQRGLQVPKGFSGAFKGPQRTLRNSHGFSGSQDFSGSLNIS